MTERHETSPGAISCASCGRRYAWRPAIAGRRVKCHCGQVMVAPHEAAFETSTPGQSESSSATRLSSSKSAPDPFPGAQEHPGPTSASLVEPRSADSALPQRGADDAPRASADLYDFAPESAPARCVKSPAAQRLSPAFSPARSA